MWGPSPDPWSYSSFCEDLPIDYSCRKKKNTMAERTIMTGGRVNLRNQNHVPTLLSSIWNPSSYTPKNLNTSDVSIITQDLEVFRLHLSVIKAMSPLFAQLLGINRSALANLVPINAYHISFLLHEIQGKYFKYVLSYMYEGTVTVPRNDLRLFQAYASYFQLEKLNCHEVSDQQRYYEYRYRPTTGSYYSSSNVTLASTEGPIGKLFPALASTEGPIGTSSPVKLDQSSNISSSPLNVNATRLNSLKTVLPDPIKKEISDEEEIPHSVSSINSLVRSHSISNCSDVDVGENQVGNSHLNYLVYLRDYLRYLTLQSKLQEPKEDVHVDVDNSYGERTLKTESMDTSPPKEEKISYNQTRLTPPNSFHREDMTNIPLHVHNISPFSGSSSPYTSSNSHSSMPISPPFSYNSLDLKSSSNSSSPHQKTSSPHQNSSSPHQNSSSPNLNSSSPHQNSSSPHQNSSSPRLEQSNAGKVRKAGEKKPWKSYKQYSQDDMRNALADYKNGKSSIQMVGKVYNIPSRTLYDKVHKMKILPINKQKNSDEVDTVATALLDLQVIRSLASSLPSQTSVQPVLSANTSQTSVILPSSTSQTSVVTSVKSVLPSIASQALLQQSLPNLPIYSSNLSPTNKSLNSSAPVYLNSLKPCRPAAQNSEPDVALSLTNKTEPILIDPGC